MGIFEDIISGETVSVKNEFKSDIIENGYDLYTEAVYPESIPYLRTTPRKITLPKGTPAGRGNLCFLYTNNTNESIELMNNSTNFINGNYYYWYYYKMMYRGRLYNKTYRIKDMDERTNLYKMIKLKTKFHPYIKLDLMQNETRNLYYDLSKHLEIFNSICDKLQPLKKIDLYWAYMSSILNYPSTNVYHNKFVLIDIDKFSLTESLKDNLKNPLFMIYYTMFRNPELFKTYKINLDFYFFTGNRCLKVNPHNVDKKTYLTLKTEMRKLFAHASKIKEMEKATDDEVLKKEEAVEETIGNIKQSVTTKKPELITNETIKKQEDDSEKIIDAKIKEKVINIRKEMEIEVPDTTDVSQELMTTVIQTKAENEIDDDVELLNEIYNKTVAKAIPKDTASTARDAKLKKEQENLTVGKMTIKEIEKANASHIPVPEKDVSAALTTTNKNVGKIKFKNFDKMYNEKVLPKDITDSFLSLNDKSMPMFIRKIEIKDTSDELNYKDTYTVYFEDSNRQRHTVKVDIPKFIEDKYLYIGGNRKIIKHQEFLYPVVKSDADIVQIVTNYNKMRIERSDTKSIESIERMKTILKKSDELKSYFIFGNSTTSNKEAITTIEYDELAKIAVSYKNKKCKIFFSQPDAIAFSHKNAIKIPKGKLFVGVDKSANPVFIDEETQVTKDNKTILDIILESCSAELQAEYARVKSPRRLMYARVAVMKQYVSVGLLLGFWEGLSTVLKKANVKYRLENSIPKDLSANEGYIKFSDTVLVYENTVPVALLLNGFKLMKTEDYEISQFDSQEAYIGYLTKVYGKIVITNALMNVYEFMIDPITLEVLKDLHLPTDIVSLIIYGVALLADSQYKPEIDQHLSRIRKNEIVPAILYERIAKNYIVYRNSNGRKKFSVPQDCVIKEILAQKTVEDYSTLNPSLELAMSYGVSSKGFRGTNLDESYTVPRRSYDPSMIGTIAAITSPDGTVGVNKVLTTEPQINSLRGYVDIKNDKLNELNDTNLFSAVELTMPTAATIDDPNRLGHAGKQSNHVIPVKDSSPVLISNGFEEACRFQLSTDFVVNADEAGEIIDYDEKSKIMIAKYKSGKCQAINLGHTIVKNGGGGFFLSNTLITDLKVGDKFKKDAVLAYHKDFFTNDKYNNCRMNLGTLSKIAICSTYNTYQDATMITESLSDKASTEMCFVRQVTIGKNANVEYIVKEGQEIKVGESLVQFDTSYEDNSLNVLLASLSDEDKEGVLEGSRNDIHSKYSGVIEEIKIYATVETDELSPSLRKIVQNYYKSINSKKGFLEKYDPDSKDSIVKCGMLVTDTSKKIETNKFSVIKGQKMEEGGVLIEFYIKHSEPLEIGSKIANFSGLKNTIGEIIPSGYEPWSEYRPEEEVSTIIASNSILKRMTPSILLTSLGNKCIIELKKSLEQIYKE